MAAVYPAGPDPKIRTLVWRSMVSPRQAQSSVICF